MEFLCVKDYICYHTAEALKERLAKLTDMQAPQIMISSTIEEIDRLEQGKLDVHGDWILLEEDFESVEEKKGKGGIKYYVFNGHINYFPKAKYGRYVSEREEK